MCFVWRRDRRQCSKKRQREKRLKFPAESDVRQDEMPSSPPNRARYSWQDNVFGRKRPLHTGHGCGNGACCSSSSELRHRRTFPGESAPHGNEELTPLLHVSPSGGLHLGLLKDGVAMGCFDVSNSCCLDVEGKNDLSKALYDASDQGGCDCSTGPKPRKCSDADRVCFRDVAWDTLMSKRVANTESCYSSFPEPHTDHATQLVARQHTETILTAWRYLLRRQRPNQRAVPWVAHSKGKDNIRLDI